MILEPYVQANDTVVIHVSRRLLIVPKFLCYLDKAN